MKWSATTESLRNTDLGAPEYGEGHVCGSPSEFERSISVKILEWGIKTEPYVTTAF
jgi:hypothetical protein